MNKSFDYQEKNKIFKEMNLLKYIDYFHINDKKDLKSYDYHYFLEIGMNNEEIIRYCNYVRINCF